MEHVRYFRVFTEKADTITVRLWIWSAGPVGQSPVPCGARTERRRGQEPFRPV